MFRPQLGVSLHTLSTDLTGELMQAIAGSLIATLELSARLTVRYESSEPWWIAPEPLVLELSELDLEKRAEYFKEIQRIATEEAAWLPHSLVTLPMAWNERVSGFKVRGNVTVDLSGVTITE